MLNRSKIILIIFPLVLIGCGSLNTTAPQTISKKISGDFTGAYLGAFVGTVDAASIDSFEQKAGKNLSVVLWYVNFTQPFPSTECDIAKSNGSIPYITWEPWKGIVSDESYSLDKISAGLFDSYISAWANACAAWGNPLFLRFAHEMNGNWYPWDGTHNGKDSSKYISAWRHIYDIFTAQGVTNATWVWCINTQSVPNESWNTASGYYPGDDYVDWVGIDGYNWGTDASPGWMSFAEIFSIPYNMLKSSYPNKPIMIGEFACSENGGSKSAWILDSFATIESSYLNIKSINWFNTNKETDWRINSSLSAESSFKQAVSSGYFK